MYCTVLVTRYSPVSVAVLYTKMVAVLYSPVLTILYSAMAAVLYSAVIAVLYSAVQCSDGGSLIVAPQWML